MIDPYTGQPFQYESGGLSLTLVSRHVPNFETVDPGTPLFWSPGAGNARLQRQKLTSRDGGKLDAQGEPFETTHYVLYGSEPLWNDEPVFVFPLPK